MGIKIEADSVEQLHQALNIPQLLELQKEIVNAQSKELLMQAWINSQRLSVGNAPVLPGQMSVAELLFAPSSQPAPLALPPAQIQYPPAQTTVIQPPLSAPMHQSASPTWQDLISEPLPPTAIQQPERKNILRAAMDDPLTTTLAILVLLVGLMLGANWINPQAGSLLLQKLKVSESVSQPAQPVPPTTPAP